VLARISMSKDDYARELLWKQQMMRRKNAFLNAMRASVSAFGIAVDAGIPVFVSTLNPQKAKDAIIKKAMQNHHKQRILMVGFKDFIKSF
jgi:hypothetical protein